MLAATPQVSSSQELFRLVLTLISSGSRDIPNSLKEHFLTVLSQAKIIVGDAEITLENVLPESIDLAFEIKEIDGLYDSLKTIDDIENVSPALADHLLNSMEHYSVYQD